MSEPRPLPVGRASLHIIDVPEAGRFEGRLGDDPTLAVLLTYGRSKGSIALLHTEVQEGYEGQGIGSRMATWAFDEARRLGLKVVPKCPFIVRWLERHPEQHDVLLHPLGSDVPRLGGRPLDQA